MVGNENYSQKIRIMENIYLFVIKKIYMYYLLYYVKYNWLKIKFFPFNCRYLYILQVYLKMLMTHKHAQTLLAVCGAFLFYNLPLLFFLSSKMFSTFLIHNIGNAWHSFT